MDLQQELGMCTEVAAAVGFLARYLDALSESQVGQFKQCLSGLLKDRYKCHWFPTNSLRGSGFRCIRNVAGKVDPVLQQAEVILPFRILASLPANFTLWVDPGDVAVRLGEQGTTWSLDLKPYASVSSSSSPDPSSKLASSPSSTRKNSINIVPSPSTPPHHSNASPPSPPMNSSTGLNHTNNQNFPPSPPPAIDSNESKNLNSKHPNSSRAVAVKA